MSDGHLNKLLFKQVFVDHIGADIRWAVEAKRHQAAAQLLLAGIDVVAGLERPEEQLDTTGALFIKWCGHYMLLEGPYYKLTGLDLWGARCGFLHTYTPNAKVVREGRAKVLGYVDASEIPVMTDPNPTLVLVSLYHLSEAFFRGMADTMKRINQNAELAVVVNERMNMMFRGVPVPKEPPDYRQKR